MSKDSVAALNGAAGAGEHFLMRVLPGDAESARRRLAEALEQLGYYVLGEEPLQARRAARGLAAWFGSNNVLKYSIALTVAVKPLSAGAARVTFCYTLNHPMLTSSGRQTLTREAEAVIAVAAIRAASSACVACGATAVAGSRFCRQCGTPSVWAEPAELGLLKVTAGLCAGYTRTAFGAGALALAFAALAFGLASKVLSASVVVFVSLLLGLVGWSLLLTGLRLLYRTLNPGQRKDSTPSDHQSDLLPGAAGATHAKRVSSEGTTEPLPAARASAPTAALKRDAE